jgi:hypothetical protein
MDSPHQTPSPREVASAGKWQWVTRWPSLVLSGLAGAAITAAIVFLVGDAALLAIIVPTDKLQAFAALLSSIAAVGVCALTVGLLLLNRQLIRATFGMAASTAEEAGATARAAEATLRQVDLAVKQLESMRLDRELAWRPYIVSSPPGHPTVDLRNVGRGPALDCFYVEHDDQNWYVVMERVTIEAGGSVMRLPLTAMPGAFPNELTADYPGPQRYVICMDQFGNWLKFDRHALAVDLWRPDEGEPPPWVEWTWS